MIKALVALPVVLTLIIGIATQLEQIAQRTGDKAVAFTDDMNKAMDCATKGVLVGVCSPELFNYTFTDEKEEFLKALEDLNEQAH